VHSHAGRFALPVSNKRQPDIIRRGYGVHVETGFAHWKEFGRIIVGHAANRGDEMISQVIRLVRDTESWAEVDQSEKKCLPVLTHIAVVDSGTEPNQGRRFGNIR